MGDIPPNIIPAYLSIFTGHPIDAGLARAAYLAFLHGLFVTCRVLLPHFFNILSPCTGGGGGGTLRPSYILILVAKKSQKFIIPWKVANARARIRSLHVLNERGNSSSRVREPRYLFLRRSSLIRYLASIMQMRIHIRDYFIIS